MYISKFALTEGIIEVPDGVLEDDDLLVIKEDDTYFTFTKQHWHEKHEDAIKAANDMRIDRIMMLELELNRLKQHDGNYRVIKWPTTSEDC